MKQLRIASPDVMKACGFAPCTTHEGHYVSPDPCTGCIQTPPPKSNKAHCCLPPFKWLAHPNHAQKGFYRPSPCMPCDTGKRKCDLVKLRYDDKGQQIDSQHDAGHDGLYAGPSPAPSWPRVQVLHSREWRKRFKSAGNRATFGMDELLAPCDSLLSSEDESEEEEAGGDKAGQESDEDEE